MLTCCKNVGCCNRMTKRRDDRRSGSIETKPQDSLKAKLPSLMRMSRPPALQLGGLTVSTPLCFNSTCHVMLVIVLWTISYNFWLLPQSSVICIIWIAYYSLHPSQTCVCVHYMPNLFSSVSHWPVLHSTSQSLRYISPFFHFSLSLICFFPVVTSY